MKRIALLLAGGIFWWAGLSAQSVVINELLAVNDSLNADSAGQFDDWIELFNPTANSVDLSQFGLSDDYALPYKWVFPNGTILGAGQYLIVWADKDTVGQAGLHTNYKLSSLGEQLMLTTPGGMVVDSVTFGAQTSNVSYARVPNGTGPWSLRTPTFAANNSPVGRDEALGGEITLWPNPTAGRLEVARTGGSGWEKIHIINSEGAVVRVSEFSAGEDSHALDLTGLAAGMYLLRTEKGAGSVFLIQY